MYFCGGSYLAPCMPHLPMGNRSAKDGGGGEGGAQDRASGSGESRKRQREGGDGGGEGDGIEGDDVRGMPVKPKAAVGSVVAAERPIFFSAEGASSGVLPSGEYRGAGDGALPSAKAEGRVTELGGSGAIGNDLDETRQQGVVPRSARSFVGPWLWLLRCLDIGHTVRRSTTI